MAEVVICSNCGNIKATLQKDTETVVCGVCDTQMQFVNDLKTIDVATMSFSEKEKYAENYIGHKIDQDLVNKRIEYKAEIHQKIYGTSSQVKCPKCNSTQIQLVNRKWSILTGFMTNKVDRVCMNCKHKF